MTKKDMKETTKINPSIESINLINDIISKMDGKTFHNHYHILWDIVNLIKNQNCKYLEIGTFAGASASLISLNPKIKEVYSIDIGNPVNKEIPIKNVNKFKHSNCLYEYIQGDSQNSEIINYVYNKIGKVDLLFIDGDHSYNAVINDFNNYKNLVSYGGFIVFDDYLDSFHSPQVFRAVNDIVKGLDTNEYEVIGSLKYDLISKTNTPNLPSSNEFILRKLI